MIDKILKDWNDRVGGNLNHKKESHLFELGSMLWEQGWSSEQIGELVKNLKEQETKFKGRTKDGDLRYFKSKDSLDKALEKGTVEPVDEPDKKVNQKKTQLNLVAQKILKDPRQMTILHQPILINQATKNMILHLNQNQPMIYSQLKKKVIKK